MSEESIRILEKDAALHSKLSQHNRAAELVFPLSGYEAVQRLRKGERTELHMRLRDLFSG